MNKTPSDFEVSIKGETFLTVQQGQLNVRGLNFQSDLASISRLMSILSDVLDSALTAQAESRHPRLQNRPVPVACNGNVYSLHQRRGRS